MTATVALEITVTVLVVVAFVACCGGGWLLDLKRRWDSDLAQLERPVPYTGPERRTDHTKYVRAGKYPRPLDVYDRTDDL